MASYDADGLSLDNLRFGIYACARPVPETVSDNLGEMPHELVVIIKLVGLNSRHLAVIAHSDQEVAARRVKKRGDRFEDGMRDDLVIFLILLEIPAQRRFELQGLRFAALDQLFSLAVGPQVMIEQEILERFPEGPVVGDSLVEHEVRVDDFLDDVFDFVVERKTDILAGVDPGAGIERRVSVELGQYLPECYPVFRS